MVEVIGEYHPDTSEETEDGLKAIATVDKSPENGNAGASGSSENGSDSDQDSGSSSSDDEISDNLRFDGEGEPTTNSNENTYKENEITSLVEAGRSCRVAGAEEEIEEFEFNKVKPTLATYSMHCPNCKAEVTGALLCRKETRLRPPVEPPPAQEIIGGLHRPLDLDRYRLLAGSSSSFSDDEITSDSLKFDGNTYKKNVEVGEVAVEEETLMEFEFKRMKPKRAKSTHSMHCSNCLTEVTRIVLRTSLWPTEPPPPPPEEPQQYGRSITSRSRGAPDLEEYAISLGLFNSSPRAGYIPSYDVGCFSCFNLLPWSWSERRKKV